MPAQREANEEGTRVKSGMGGAGFTVLVAAMQSEVRGILPALRGVKRVRGRGLAAWEGLLGGRRVICLRSGMGWRKAERALTLLGEGASGVVSVGFAGGLDEKARLGDLVVATEFLWGEVQIKRYQVDRRWVSLLERAAGQAGRICHLGRVYCVDSPLLAAEKKREAGALLGAIAVEMEARGLVSVAAKWRVPVAMLRVVVDPVECTVPPLPFVAGIRASERMRAAVDPKGWIQLIQLARQVRRVVPALTEAVCALGSDADWSGGTCP